jgi:GR25 family glycosyltransferase involved in LPS biosynthesis
MIPSFVINLEEEKHRWDLTNEHLKENGISPKRVIGFNGIHLGIAPFNVHDIAPNGERIFQHPTQLAVTLGHLLALRSGIDTDAPWFIVFEDDAAVENRVEITEVVSEAERYGIGVVQMEYSTELSKQPISKSLSICRYPWGAAAILWSRQAAVFTISNLRPLCSPIDIMLPRMVYPFVGHAVTTTPIFRQRSVTEWSSHCTNKIL